MYRDADGACLVYDITDAESFEKVKTWVKELRKIVGENICIAMAGNKIDLEKDRHVKESDALAYAKSVGAIHMHTSAKANKGVDEIFTELALRILEKKKKGEWWKGKRKGGSFMRLDKLHVRLVC